MLLNIKTVKGKEIILDVEPTDTLTKIKELIEEKEGVLTEYQKLVYKGRVMMNEDKSVEFHKLKEGTQLFVLTFCTRAQILNNQSMMKHS